MSKLTQQEIEEIIYREFCKIPCSEIAREERKNTIMFINEIIEIRKKNNEWVNHYEL